MKPHLPSTSKIWATAGLIVVALIAIFAKDPFWLGVASFLFSACYGFVLFTTPKTPTNN